jgi:hypothetical protein
VVALVVSDHPPAQADSPLVEREVVSPNHSEEVVLLRMPLFQSSLVYKTKPAVTLGANEALGSSLADRNRSTHCESLLALSICEMSDVEPCRVDGDEFDVMYTHGFLFCLDLSYKVTSLSDQIPQKHRRWRVGWVWDWGLGLAFWFSS